MKSLKRFFVLATAIVMTAMSGTGTVQAADMVDTYPLLNKISTSEIFQQEDSYYVYFYMERCPYCNEVKSEINEFAASGGNIYGVDYAQPQNRVNSYDWSTAAEKYNKKIGYIDATGTKQFHQGESEEKYLNSVEKNIYGKVIRYQITQIDEYNIGGFPGASIDDLYAEVQTPEINYAVVTNPADLIIAGVPTVLHIVNGRVEGFYFDSIEIATLLESLK